jgi:hypothetical protein
MCAQAQDFKLSGRCTVFSRHPILSFACALLLVCVAACGGGGGGSAGTGGGSSGGGGGSGGGSGVSVPLPRNLAASVPETTTGPVQRRLLTTFNVTTTSTEMPQNVRLTGADATPFTVEVEISAPNAQNVRTVTMTLVVTGSLDFESPSDIDRNNIYVFDIEGSWLGQALISTISVTVTDVPDASLLQAKFIAGTVDGQNFGSAIQPVADIDGDGRRELGVSIQSFRGDDAAYILSSTVLGDNATGRFALATFSGHTLISNPGTVIPRISPVSPIDPLNHVSTAPAGSGFDLAFSDSNSDRIFLVPVRTTAERQALAGTINPANLSGVITYSFSSRISPVWESDWRCERRWKQ